MAVPPLILASLDELGADDFKRFRWNLSYPVLDGCRPIPQGCLEKAERPDVVRRMIHSYGEEPAVKVTVEILKKMNLNNEAKKLQNARADDAAVGETSENRGASASQSEGPRAEIQQDRVPADQKLFSARAEFINSVSDPNLNQLLDKLLQRGVISEAEMESARTKTRADKAQDVIDTVRRKGSEPSSDLIAALREVDPCLSRKLNFS